MISGEIMNELRKFKSGATRSADADSERYDLMPPGPARRAAIIYAEGAVTHGDNNWKKGVPNEVVLNHLERHLILYKLGDRSEDHLAKIRVNADFLMYYEDERINVDKKDPSIPQWDA